MKITLVQGDITTIPVDAIVNAANPYLRGGGGVDGAIQRAAGPELLAECRKLPVLSTEPGVPIRCHVGDAKLTLAYRLPAKYVIHAVGPVWCNYSNKEARRLLVRAHVLSLLLAQKKGCKTISFPAISCGLYGFPLVEAAKLSVLVMRRLQTSLDEVVFVMFTEDTFAAWQGALNF